MSEVRASDRDAIIAWFSEMSMVNQFAAGVNPRDWAEVQARGKDVSADELERRARVWADFLRELAKEES